MAWCVDTISNVYTHTIVESTLDAESDMYPSLSSLSSSADEAALVFFFGGMSYASLSTWPRGWGE